MLSPGQESVVQAVPDSRQDMPGKTGSKYLVNSSIHNEYGCAFGKQASVSTSQVCLNTWKTRRKERGAGLVDLLPVSLLPSRGLPLSAWIASGVFRPGGNPSEPQTPVWLPDRCHVADLLF